MGFGGLAVPVRLEQPEHLRVQLLALLLKDARVGNLLDQGVRECQPTTPVRGLLEKSCIPQHDKRARELFCTQVADSGQQHLREGATDHGCHLEQPPLGSGQAVDARGDHALNVLGNAQLAERPLEAVAAGLAEQQPLLGQHLDHLLEEHRRALGIGEQTPFELGKARVVAEKMLEKGPGAAPAERVEEQDRGLDPGLPYRLLGQPGGNHEHDRRPGHGKAEVVQRGQGLPVEPVHVLHDQDLGPRVGAREHQVADAVQHAPAPEVRVELRPLRVLQRRQAQEGLERRPVRVQARAEAAE